MTSAAVLVIGASRGIGLEFVRQYAGAGARVIATHRAPADAERLRTLGAEPVRLDVLDAASPAALARALAARPLSVAILNAGVYGPRTQGVVAPDVADFDHVMHTNVLAAMRLIPTLAPALAASRGTLAASTRRAMSSRGRRRTSRRTPCREEKRCSKCVGACRAAGRVAR